MMPGGKSRVSRAIIRITRPNRIGRLVAYASMVVIATLKAVPTTVMARLTQIEWATAPALKMVAYASNDGCAGQSTMPPPLVMSWSLARLVARTLTNG